MDLLSHGQVYRIVVVATSGAGLFASASVAFTADLESPTIAAVWDGEILDVACANSLDPYTCSWKGLSDAMSGLISIEWGVGTAPYATDLYPFTANTNVTMGSGRTTGPLVGVSTGSTVYCTVRATDRAGGQSLRSSNGARILEPTCAEPFVCLS